MRFTSYIFPALCVAALGGCAGQNTANDTMQASVTAPESGQAASVEAEGRYVDKVVCKRIMHTGSRTNTSKTCATVAEWEELSRSSQDAVNEHSRRTGMSNRMEGQ